VADEDGRGRVGLDDAGVVVGDLLDADPGDGLGIGTGFVHGGGFAGPARSNGIVAVGGDRFRHGCNENEAACSYRA
jgi:hypothetical protein